MPVLEREEFSLLNLSDSASESIPDLDLVQNTRKLHKRKVKYKKRSRGLRGKDGMPGNSTSGGFCDCGTGSIGCRVVGVVFLVSCVGSLLYLMFTMSGKVRLLEERISKVDDASKSVPASIIQIKSTIETLQSNETAVYIRLSELEGRLVSLEATVQQLATQHQPEEVQQNLLHLGAKASEAKSNIDSLIKSTELNSQALKKLSDSFQSIKDGSAGGGVEEDSAALTSLRSDIQESRTEFNKQAESIRQLNETVNLVAYNSTARMNWFNQDFLQLKGRVSQMEDDNRNISSRLESLDKTLNPAVSELKLNLSEVEKLVHSLQPSSPPLHVPGPPLHAPQTPLHAPQPSEPSSVRQGPRDKKLV